jgi:hypothetical protein
MKGAGPAAATTDQLLSQLQQQQRQAYSDSLYAAAASAGAMAGEPQRHQQVRVFIYLCVF